MDNKNVHDAEEFLMVLAMERAELISKMEAAREAVNLINILRDADLLTEAIAGAALADEPYAHLLNENTWTRRQHILSTCLDAVEDDILLLERIGDEAQLDAVAMRGLLRYVVLREAFSDPNGVEDDYDDDEWDDIND